MPRSPRRNVRLVVVFLAFTVLGLVGLRSLRARRGERRLALAKETVDASCRAYRTQPGHEHAYVCRFDAYAPVSYDRFRRARAEITTAEAAIAGGDVGAAGRALVAAASHVREMNLAGFIGASLAADAVGAVLDVLAAHPTIDARGVVAQLAVPDADRPLEAWRTHRMWGTARYRQERLLAAPKLDDGEIATAIEEEDATFRAMERAVVAGDVAECERRARGFATPTEDAKFNVALCGQAAKIIRADARLRAVRAKL